MARIGVGVRRPWHGMKIVVSMERLNEKWRWRK
jgi:hypothetical protein